MIAINDLDQFTRAYIEAMLFAETGPAYGTCPCCGKVALLDHLPEPDYDQQAMCGNPGCGVRPLDNEPPLDENYTPDDLTPESMARIKVDCDKFQSENREHLDAAKYEHPEYSDAAMAGHDFWLTRNRHGVGFWDRQELPEDVRAELTSAAHAFGECNIYVGDDGKLHV